MTQELFLATDVMENVSRVRTSFGCTQLAVRNTPTLASGDPRHWQADTVHQVVQLSHRTPPLTPRSCLGIFIQLTPFPRTGLGHKTLTQAEDGEGPSPLLVELQGVALALMSDLVFWQATVAVQLYVILVPGHLWLWIS